MAQPQGLNVPAIMVTAIIGVILTGSVVEGVRAYYNYSLKAEEEAKWSTVKVRTVDILRDHQERALKFDTRVPIEAAMSQIARSGGKLPSTRPGNS